MWTFIFANWFLLAQALLEYGQALTDIVHGNYPRAVVMMCAGTSSLAFIWLV